MQPILGQAPVMIPPVESKERGGILISYAPRFRTSGGLIYGWQARDFSFIRFGFLVQLSHKEAVCEARNRIV